MYAIVVLVLSHAANTLRRSFIVRHAAGLWRVSGLFARAVVVSTVHRLAVRCHRLFWTYWSFIRGRHAGSIFLKLYQGVR